MSIYLVCYSDAFGRELYEEVESPDEEYAVETVQEENADGLYVPEIISVERFY